MKKVKVTVLYSFFFMVSAASVFYRSSQTHILYQGSFSGMLIVFNARRIYRFYEFVKLAHP